MAKVEDIKLVLKTFHCSNPEVKYQAVKSLKILAYSEAEKLIEAGAVAELLEAISYSESDLSVADISDTASETYILLLKSARYYFEDVVNKSEPPLLQKYSALFDPAYLEKLVYSIAADNKLVRRNALKVSVVLLETALFIENTILKMQYNSKITKRKEDAETEGTAPERVPLRTIAFSGKKEEILTQMESLLNHIPVIIQNTTADKEKPFIKSNEGTLSGETPEHRRSVGRILKRAAYQIIYKTAQRCPSHPLFVIHFFNSIKKGSVDKDPEVRRLAVESLAEIELIPIVLLPGGIKQYCKILNARLKDAKMEVRIASLKCLERLLRVYSGYKTAMTNADFAKEILIYYTLHGNDINSRINTKREEKKEIDEHISAHYEEIYGDIYEGIYKEIGEAVKPLLTSETVRTVMNSVTQSRSYNAGEQASFIPDTKAIRRTLTASSAANDERKTALSLKVLGVLTAFAKIKPELLLKENCLRMLNDLSIHADWQVRKKGGALTSLLIPSCSKDDAPQIRQILRIILQDPDPLVRKEILPIVENIINNKHLENEFTRYENINDTSADSFLIPQEMAKVKKAQARLNLTEIISLCINDRSSNVRKASYTLLEKLLSSVDRIELGSMSFYRDILSNLTTEEEDDTAIPLINTLTLLVSKGYIPRKALLDASPNIIKRLTYSSDNIKFKILQLLETIADRGYGDVLIDSGAISLLLRNALEKGAVGSKAKEILIKVSPTADTKNLMESGIIYEIIIEKVGEKTARIKEQREHGKVSSDAGRETENSNAVSKALFYKNTLQPLLNCISTDRGTKRRFGLEIAFLLVTVGETSFLEDYEILNALARIAIDEDKIEEPVKEPLESSIEGGTGKSNSHGLINSKLCLLILYQVGKLKGASLLVSAGVIDILPAGLLSTRLYRSGILSVLKMVVSNASETAASLVSNGIIEKLIAILATVLENKPRDDGPDLNKKKDPDALSTIELSVDALELLAQIAESTIIVIDSIEKLKKTLISCYLLPYDEISAEALNVIYSLSRKSGKNFSALENSGNIALENRSFKDTVSGSPADNSKVSSLLTADTSSKVHTYPEMQEHGGEHALAYFIQTCLNEPAAISAFIHRITSYDFRKVRGASAYFLRVLTIQGKAETIINSGGHLVLKRFLTDDSPSVRYEVSAALAALAYFKYADHINTTSVMELLYTHLNKDVQFDTGQAVCTTHLIIKNISNPTVLQERYNLDNFISKLESLTNSEDTVLVFQPEINQEKRLSLKEIAQIALNTIIETKNITKRKSNGS
ncbi:MAG: hypothetical protein QW728_00935 [Thermoplasmata archaeon]